MNNGEYTIGNLTGDVVIGGTVNVKNGGTFGIAGDTVTLSNGFRFSGADGGAWDWAQNGSLSVESGGD
jgi:hypothetical protein